MDSCHTYTYVGNDREVHKNFVMWFVTWKPKAQVMYQLSTSSYHLHIWYETAIMHKRVRPNIYERKRMYYHWVIFLYSFQEVIISVLYCLKLTQNVLDLVVLLSNEYAYIIVFLILDTIEVSNH
jgi:hypothetical protein